MNDDKVEELPEVESVEDEIKACDHPLEVLLQDDTGFWVCMCGTIGRIGADFDRRIKFIVPRQKQTRQERRAWERTIIKEFTKSQKRKFRESQKTKTTT